jgi:hypothetical protein
MTIDTPSTAYSAVLSAWLMEFGRAQGGNRDAFRSLRRRYPDVLDERDQSAGSSLPPEDEAVAGETPADVDTITADGRERSTSPRRKGPRP